MIRWNVLRNAEWGMRNGEWTTNVFRIPNSEFRILRGFTLVEMMLVVIIIATLAAMVIPRLAGRTEQAKISRAQADLASVGLALDLYELDMGRYPASLEALTSREAPSDLGSGVQWNGPYLKKGLPNDPWGRPYSFARESQHNQDYDLWSLGPDGQPGNDDVTNWD